MFEYHKIQSIYKRDEKTHKFLDGMWSLKEFEYLKDNKWVFTEKVDGTNIRVDWDKDTKEIKFGGKTDNSQMPTLLLDKLLAIFKKETFLSLYPDTSMCLYGEGHGNKIQKAGRNYKTDGVDFVLFDIKIDEAWLERADVEDIANKLGIALVPIIGIGTIEEAIGLVRCGFNSKWSTQGNDFMAEGLVLRPLVELKSRTGYRIITKLKTRDFK